jgi:hypothetical protein
MKNRTLFHGILALMISAVFMITGCGGGSDDANSAGGQQQEQYGEIVVSLTDAAGDFVSYTVDVLSMNLIRADGTEVSALPLQTRIDFTQYTEMTEFLTVATIPVGMYVEASLTLDYAYAEIWVEDEAGDMVQVTEILDEEGIPVSTMSMTVQLEDLSSLVIEPGVPAHLLLDFNLEVSNQVNFDAGGLPTVIVEPLLVADVDRAGVELHRLRGLLGTVSVDEGTFSVYLRPFYCSLSGDHRKFGIRDVQTTDTTVFNINGEAYVGKEGLTTMAELTPLAAVVAMGDLMFHPLRFEAREVYAGSSVPGGELDAVKGTVVKREDDTLTVKGATLIRNDGTIIFNARATVEIGADTTVHRQFSTDSFDKGDISIGQRVTIGGEVTDTNPLSLSMDATQGYARILLTTVRGTLKAVDEENPTAQLDMALQSINRHRMGIFDFTGTGIDEENDADPENYEINIGTLALPPIYLDAPLKVRGFVQPFGQAPADFNAQTVIDVADARAFMKVKWSPPTDTAFEYISQDALVLNLEGTGPLHHVFRGGVATDLSHLEQSPMVEAREDGAGAFIIRYQGIEQTVFLFDAFIETLQEYLEDGAGVAKISAVGEFDDAADILIADTIDIQLK